MCWIPADVPPHTPKGTWSGEKVCWTNYGDVFNLAYFNGEDGGCWQRPHRFNDGEVVLFWAEKPHGV